MMPKDKARENGDVFEEVKYQAEKRIPNEVCKQRIRHGNAIDQSDSLTIIVKTIQTIYVRTVAIAAPVPPKLGTRTQLSNNPRTEAPHIR